jgi:hypothetical protein
MAKTKLVKEGNGKSFIQKVLTGLNKTEAQKQEDTVKAFVEDSIIDCQSQIAHLKTSLIPSKELEIVRLKNDLAKAEKNYETARFSIASNFNNYIEKRNYANNAISEVESRIASKQSQLAQLNAELVAFEEVLTDLQS